MNVLASTDLTRRERRRRESRRRSARRTYGTPRESPSRRSLRVPDAGDLRAASGPRDLACDALDLRGGRLDGDRGAAGVTAGDERGRRALEPPERPVQQPNESLHLGRRAAEYQERLVDLDRVLFHVRGPAAEPETDRHREPGPPGADGD